MNSTAELKLISFELFVRIDNEFDIKRILSTLVAGKLVITSIRTVLRSVFFSVCLLVLLIILLKLLPRIITAQDRTKFTKDWNKTQFEQSSN